MAFKGNSRSSAMPSIVKSPGLRTSCRNARLTAQLANRAVNSDWAVNSVSRCKKLGQLTIWLTVCHAVTDLLT